MKIESRMRRLEFGKRISQKRKTMNKEEKLTVILFLLQNNSALLQTVFARSQLKRHNYPCVT